jgi:choline dehydrogenase-like flavoprotein
MKAGTESDLPDVCIIGAGLVGGLMAYELANRGLTVVVLEAGPRYSLGERMAYMQDIVYGRIPGHPFVSNFPERDVYSNVGKVYYPLNVLRAKAVGGSTLHWGGEALRFIASDFRLKSLYDIADDWPITYDEIEPYYVKAERALGVAGIADNPFASPRSADFPLPPFPYSVTDKLFERACGKLGIKVHHVAWARNSKPYQGRPACVAFATCGTHRICPIAAQYTSEGHIALAEASGKATVIANASVVRLVTDSNKRIVSAVYMNREKQEAEQKARVFVLAAHAVETARLLLLSESSRFPDGLANGSGMVGRNFMERPAVGIASVIEEDVFPYRIGFHTLETHQFCDPANRHEMGALKMACVDNTGPTPYDLAASSGNWGQGLADEIRRSFGHTIEAVASIEQLPDPENRITLDPTLRDFFGDPAPRFNYSYGTYEKATIAASSKLCREILAAVGGGKISDDEDHGFAGHPMGTCRMGDDPNTSVVDRNLLAHEVPNLFVVGSSVFVTGSSLQPSLTIAALAIRAAEFIAAGGKA